MSHCIFLSIVYMIHAGCNFLANILVLLKHFGTHHIVILSDMSSYRSFPGFLAMYSCIENKTLLERLFCDTISNNSIV